MMVLLLYTSTFSLRNLFCWSQKLKVDSKMDSNLSVQKSEDVQFSNHKESFKRLLQEVVSM